MIGVIYALTGLCAAMFGACVMAGWRLINSRDELADSRVSLTRTSADLEVTQANLAIETERADDNKGKAEQLAANNSHDRKAQDDVDTAKIKTAGNAAELVAAGASVWQSMPTGEGATTGSGETNAVQPATTAATDSAKRRR